MSDFNSPLNRPGYSQLITKAAAMEEPQVQENPIRHALYNALWSDYQADANFPTRRPLLAHYTSVSTFEKMLEHGEVWLSNPLYMNDLEEMRFGMLEGASALREHKGLAEACGSSEGHADLVGAFDDMFREFEKMHAMDVYVFCLSVHEPEDNDGVLSMWRGYASNGAGVAVVFDSAKITDTNASPFVFSSVVYASTVERRQWIESKLQSIAAIVAAHEKSLENLRWAAHYWMERLTLFSLFTKHNGFAEEREWRVVYFGNRDHAATYAHMRGYLVTGKGVEPKLKVKVHELPSRKPIDELIERIILGPTISTALATESVKRMLELKRKPDLTSRVVASTIPFRA